MNKLLLGTAFIGASLLIGGVAHADTNVYRLYNHNTGEHFYTTSGTEKNANVSAGWTYEGVGWVAPTTSSSPVYRVYNPNAMGGDHYYTKSKYEAQSLVNKGWKWDNNGKAVFYSGGSQAVYVAYNPNAQSGAHNYTESSFEQNSLLNTGWKYGAVAWYGVGAETAKPSTPSTPVTPSQPTVPKVTPPKSSSKPATVDKNLQAVSKTITRTINYKLGTAQIASPVTQKITFTGSKNKVTGATTWSNPNQSFSAVVSPKKSGYVASITTVASKAVTPSSANITVNVTYSLAPLSLSGFQNAVAKDLQTLIMNEITTVNSAASLQKGTDNSRQSDLNNLVQQYSSSPTLVGDFNQLNDWLPTSLGGQYFTTTSYSGGMTAANAQQAAKSLFNSYMAEKKGYEILANATGQTLLYGNTSTTVNGITYSVTGTYGTYPSRVGFYDDLLNNGAYQKGVNCYIAVKFDNSAKKIYAGYCYFGY